MKTSDASTTAADAPFVERGQGMRMRGSCLRCGGHKPGRAKAPRKGAPPTWICFECEPARVAAKVVA